MIRLIILDYPIGHYAYMNPYKRKVEKNPTDTAEKHYEMEQR